MDRRPPGGRNHRDPRGRGVLKGSLGSALTFRVPGGRLGRFRSIVVGAPSSPSASGSSCFSAIAAPGVPVRARPRSGGLPSRAGWLELECDAARDRRRRRRRHRAANRARRPRAASARARRVRTPGAVAGRERPVTARAPDAAAFVSVARAGCGARLGDARPAAAYLKFGIVANGQQISIKWAKAAGHAIA